MCKVRVYRFSFCIFSLLSSLLLCVSPLSTANVCPAVDCDCSSLTSKNWQTACLQYESTLKDQCASNDGNPINYCAIHGVAAFPVALSFKPIPMSAPLPSKEDEFERQLDMILWSLETDMELANARLRSYSLAQVFEALKIIETNIEAAFSIRQSEDDFLVAEDKSLSLRKKKWEAFADIVSNYQLSLDDFSQQLFTLHTQSDKEKLKRSFGSLAVKSLRVSGKLKEMLAVVYHESGNDELSAKSWTAAGDDTSQLISIQKKLDGKPEYLAYFQLLAATEYHRGSLYWLLADNLTMAQNNRLQAKVFMPQTQEIEDLLMSQE